MLCNKYSVSKAVVCNDVSVDDVSAAAATDNDNSCREEEDDAREGGGGGGIEYDAEWLVVLQKTHYLLQTHRGVVNLPTTIDPATPEVTLYLNQCFFFYNSHYLLSHRKYQ